MLDPLLGHELCMSWIRGEVQYVHKSKACMLAKTWHTSDGCCGKCLKLCNALPLCASVVKLRMRVQVGVVGSGKGMTDYKSVARHDFNPDAE